MTRLVTATIATSDASATHGDNDSDECSATKCNWGQLLGDSSVCPTLEHPATKSAVKDGFLDGVTHLRVLGGDTGGGTVGATEGDGAVDSATGHVVELASRVDDLVDGLHREVPGH